MRGYNTRDLANRIRVYGVEQNTVEEDEEPEYMGALPIKFYSLPEL